MKQQEGMENKGLRPRRKEYVKIKIEQVQLVLEEAVLGTGCKAVTSTGPDSTSCLISNCLIDGS